MCQGQCSAEICRNETLRCDEIESYGTAKINITSLNRSEVIEEHSYCKADSVLGNKIIDIIDRSDEEIENTLTVPVTDARIDYSYLTNCNINDRPGVTCYQSSNKTGRKTQDCRLIEYWCRTDVKDSCVANADETEISTNDKNLCGNKTLWKYVPTDYYRGHSWKTLSK